MSAQTVPIHFVHRFLLQVERRGIDAAPLLRAAGISGDIAYNPRTRVTVEQAAKVTRDVWRLTDDELFGIGPPIPRGTFQLVAMSLIHGPDLRTMLTRMDDATRVLPGVPQLTATVGERVTRVQMDVSELDDPEHLGTDLLTAFVHRVAGWLIGRRIPLLRLEFPYPEPPFAADYLPIFGVLPVFGAETVAFEFDNGLLSSPIVRSELDLAHFLSDQPTVWYATRDYGTTTADQVRKILEQGLKGEWPTPEEIGARLAMSAQHVRRLLREEDTSISQIKEEILRDAAIESLVRGEESVHDLAARLGFSEASAFRRAFRRWTGSPPGAYRDTTQSPD